MRLVIAHTLSLAALLLSAPRARAQDPCADGYWEAPANHDVTGFVNPPPGGRFIAAHMALIPKGPHRGKVLVWDYDGSQTLPAWTQRWSIVDASVPASYSFLNFDLTLPKNGGDFFCAAFAWTPGGDLFLAGGTLRYQSGSHHLGGGQSFLGGFLSYLYEPELGPNGTWTRQPDLELGRWYPTVAPIGNGQMLVFGGTGDTAGHFNNNYEAFDPLTRTWQDNGGTQVFGGPQDPAGNLDLYPRIQLLSTGDVFLSGMTGYSARMNHVLAPGSWTATAPMSVDYRDFNSSVLAPNRYGPDLVMTIGGEGYLNGQSVGMLESVEACWAAASGPPDWNWFPAGSLNVGRKFANAVLLPDASIVVIGGEIDPEDGAPAFTRATERFDPDSLAWNVVAKRSSFADYHSTAVLLPDGRVLSAGGENRSWDYQVYAPPYLACGSVRPVITDAPDVLPYFASNPVLHRIHHQPLPAGERVDRVVLMRASSTTHHSNFEQRYVELYAVGYRTPTTIDVLAPWDGNAAPPGYYMLFLVSDLGVPSVAHWVVLE